MTILANIKLSYALYKRRKQPETFTPTLEQVMDARLAVRKQLRLALGARVKSGISAARREAWKRDPLMRGQV
jgi:hypothetical protein